MNINISVILNHAVNSNIFDMNYNKNLNDQLCISRFIFYNLSIFLPGLPGQPYFYSIIIHLRFFSLYLYSWCKSVILFCFINARYNLDYIQWQNNSSVTERMFVRKSAKLQHVLKIDIDL